MYEYKVGARRVSLFAKTGHYRVHLQFQVDIWVNMFFKCWEREREMKVMIMMKKDEAGSIRGIIEVFFFSLHFECGILK